MGAGVGWLVHVDDTVFQVILEWPFEGSGAGGDGGVVVGQYVHLVIVFQEEGPFFGLDGSRLLGGFDDVLIILAFFLDDALLLGQLLLTLFLGHC